MICGFSTHKHTASHTRSEGRREWVFEKLIVSCVWTRKASSSVARLKTEVVLVDYDDGSLLCALSTTNEHRVFDFQCCNVACRRANKSVHKVWRNSVYISMLLFGIKFCRSRDASPSRFVSFRCCGLIVGMAVTFRISLQQNRFHSWVPGDVSSEWPSVLHTLTQ